MSRRQSARQDDLDGEGAHSNLWPRRGSWGGASAVLRSILEAARRAEDERTGGFTPNFPAYPSGHATFGAAVLHITRLYLQSIGKATIHSDGSDDVAFDLVSDEFNGVSRDVDGSVRTRHVRRFSSLLQAIVENSVSRVYLGVHWRFDGTTGGYDSDKEGPSAEFNSDEDSLVVPRDSIGGVPLGLEIAEAIFQSGLQPSTASLANGVPPPPSTARGSEPLGRRQGTRYRPLPTGPRGAPACLWGSGPTRAGGAGGSRLAPGCLLPGPPGPPRRALLQQARAGALSTQLGVGQGAA